MKILFLSIIIILLTSCKISSIYPAAGAGAGGAVGSLGGPVSGGLGAVAGYSVGEVLMTKDQPGNSAFDPEEYQELIALVNASQGEQKGFIQKIEEGIYDILKIIGMIILITVGGAVLYTRLKCNKTLKMLGFKNDDLGGIQSGGK